MNSQFMANLDQSNFQSEKDIAFKQRVFTDVHKSSKKEIMPSTKLADTAKSVCHLDLVDRVAT